MRNAYWDYVFAMQSVEVAKRSVDLAEQLVKDNQTRVEIGTMAPIDIVQAQSQAATQRQNLATAEGTRRTAELALKRLIVGGTEDPNWSGIDSTRSIGPTSSPRRSTSRPPFVARSRIAPTCSRRRKNLQVNDVTLKYLQQPDAAAGRCRRALRPDRPGRHAVHHAAAPGINRVVHRRPFRAVTATRSARCSTATIPTWNVSLNVSYPIGTSAAEANVARAHVQQNQVEAQLKQIELQIATDVTNAATQVQSNVERVQAAQVAREFAQRTLEAEQSKFEVGM